MRQAFEDNEITQEALRYVERLMKDPVQAVKEDALFSGLAHLGHLVREQDELFAEPLTEQLCRVIWRTKDSGGEHLEVTALCERTASGMRLIQCGVTRLTDELEENRFEHLLRELRNRESQLEELTRSIPCGAHRCGDDERLPLLWMSDSFFTMFGYTRKEIHELFNDNFMNMVHPNDREGMKRSMAEQLAQGPDLALEYRVMHKNGGTVWILDKGRLWDDGNGKKSYCCLLIETSDRKSEQEALRLSLERHQVIMDQTTDIIFEWDITGDHLHFSTNWEKKFGYEPIRSAISQRIPLSENIHPEDIPAFVKLMRDTAAGVPYSETEFRIRNIEGCFFWCRIRATAQFDSSGRPIKAVGVISDITVEKREKELLLEMAQKDALTGLFNKAAIQAQIEARISHGSDSRPQTLLIIDVDNFKAVNDTYGHLCGDNVLSDVAETLKQHFRASDLIGRIGGDEFLVYLPEVASREAAEKKANQLLEKLHQIRPERNAAPISCSIGAAMPSNGEADYRSLYHDADQALYYQKSQGKNGVSFFQEALCGRVHGGDAAYTAVGGAIVSDEMTVVEEQLAQYTFRMLYRSVDIPTAVNQLLEIVGRAYHASRAYICERSLDGPGWEQTFQWFAPGIPQTACPCHLDHVDDLERQVAELTPCGARYSRENRQLQCAVMDADVCRGIVCFDENPELRRWNKQQLATLTLISDVLSVFLTKKRKEQKLQHLLESPVP